MRMTTALGINAAINLLATFNLFFWITMWIIGYNHHVASAGCFISSVMFFSNWGFERWIKKHYVQAKNQNQG